MTIVVENVRDHLTDSEAVCFRIGMFVFIKVSHSLNRGSREATHIPLMFSDYNLLRDLCEVEFGRCVFCEQGALG